MDSLAFTYIRLSRRHGSEAACVLLNAGFCVQSIEKSVVNSELDEEFRDIAAAYSLEGSFIAMAVCPDVFNCIQHRFPVPSSDSSDRPSLVLALSLFVSCVH